MFRTFALITTLVCPSLAVSQDVDRIVDTHILPGYDHLATATAELSNVASETCEPTDQALRSAYHAAFDAWLLVSHLRFGPSETAERGFAIYFWPDVRGKAQKGLSTLIRDEDPVANDPAAFSSVSVAARGLFAMELMLYDQAFADAGSAEYRCSLIQAIAGDLAKGSAAIQTDWLNGYADLMRNAGDNDTYRSEEEALRQIFTALTTGLEFTADVRLARPLGTFDRPRPNRAEARRSGRSLRNVDLSLTATRELASLMSEADASLDARFANALERVEALDDPVFAGVSEPQGRFAVEVVQQSINQIRRQIAQDLGPQLGIAAGFNSLDGD